jgi:DeoR/GlpR family transcriptional regulator of sugar metabolism
MTQDEINRRAGGRRKHQSMRRLRALLRRGEILELLKQTGFRRGAQAEIARTLKVSESTISRDFKDIRARFRPCPTCGAVKPIRNSPPEYSPTSTVEVS